MPTKTRLIVTLAALSLATGACADQEGQVTSTTRHDGSATSTVLQLRDARSARAEATRLLAEAYETPLGARVCDLHKETLDVPGIPGARGVVVDKDNTTKVATIVFSKGRYAFRVSAEADAAALRLARLERAARRAYLG